MKLKPDWRRIKEQFNSIYLHSKTKLNELLDLFYAHYFLMNLIFVGFVFLIIILDFEGIRAVQDIDGFSEKQWKFVFYGFFLWTFLLLGQVLKLLLFEAKAKQYKRPLKDEFHNVRVEREKLISNLERNEKITDEKLNKLLDLLMDNTISKDQYSIKKVILNIPLKTISYLH